MALKKCKDCGERVSKNAPTCPHCGAPLKKQRRSSGSGCLGCLVLVLLCSVGGFWAMDQMVRHLPEVDVNRPPRDPNEWKTTPDKTMAEIISRDYVKPMLKSPGSAKFPWPSETRVTYHGDQTYTVRSYVDSQNSFGALIRTHYVVKVQQTGKIDWQPIDVKFVE